MTAEQNVIKCSTWAPLDEQCLIAFLQWGISDQDLELRSA